MKRLPPGREQPLHFVYSVNGFHLDYAELPSPFGRYVGCTPAGRVVDEIRFLLGLDGDGDLFLRILLDVLVRHGLCGNFLVVVVHVDLEFVLLHLEHPVVHDVSRHLDFLIVVRNLPWNEFCRSVRCNLIDIAVQTSRSFVGIALRFLCGSGLGNAGLLRAYRFYLVLVGVGLLRAVGEGDGRLTVALDGLNLLAAPVDVHGGQPFAR